jgi:hypothetical protein
VLTADARFLLQLAISGFFGSLAGLHLAAHKVKAVLEGFLFSFAEEDLVLIFIEDHDAVHDFIRFFHTYFL